MTTCVPLHMQGGIIAGAKLLLRMYQHVTIEVGEEKFIKITDCKYINGRGLNSMI